MTTSWRARLALPLVAATALFLSGSGLAQTARPYGAADLELGDRLSARIDEGRIAASKDEKGVVEPYKVLGDTYFVGMNYVGIFLVSTPGGLVLIDSGWPDTCDKTVASIEKLGFKVSDIKIMLSSEAGPHHVGGAACLKAKSGAQLMTMEGDNVAVERGGPIENPNWKWPPAHVDRVLKHRDKVTLGGVTFTAYNVRGPRKGATSWVWRTKEDGRDYTMTVACCWFTPANVVSDPEYPTAALSENWAILKSIPVDVPLGIHTYHFDMTGKLARLKAGDKYAFVDPQGYRGVIAHFEHEFTTKLAKQRIEGPPPRSATPAPPPS